MSRFFRRSRIHFACLWPGCGRLRCAGLLRGALVAVLAYIFPFLISPQGDSLSHAAGLPQLQEKFEVYDPNPGAYDSFGYSVAVEGNIAVVGMASSVDGQGPSRAAYVYRMDSGELLRTLMPISEEVGDAFGRSVAISGNLVVVGAEFEDVETATGTRFNVGAAHVYDLSTGNHIARLVPSDQQGNGFVGNVAIDGTNVLLGGRVGAAYLFDALTGQQLAKIVPSTPTDQFGVSLALQGTTALIGANSDASLGSFTGAAYVFDISTNTELRKIVPTDAGAGDNFGFAVDLEGTSAIIGSPLHSGSSPYSGAAYVFDVTSGEQLAELLPDVPNSSLAFGVDVDIDGSRAMVGSPNDGRRGQLAGAAYLFDWMTESAITELVPSDIKAGDSFGCSVGLSGSYLVAGATKDELGVELGSAYFFVIPEPSSFLLAVIGMYCLSVASHRSSKP